MEPWHVSQTVYWSQDDTTEHDRCLARIHVMEHELGMSPDYSQHCELCRNIAQDALWHRVASRYDPGIEGRLRR